MSNPTILYPQADTLWGGDPDFSITGTGDSIPWGVDAIFQYNGLIFNDKSVIDKIVVNSIEGTDDADVRDVREDLPSEDGEAAYDSHYGGRTLVFNGRIEAYQRDKLRDMEMAFRTAFNELEEKPLHFLTGDITKDHYIKCRKISKLLMTEEQKHLNHYFRDYQLTVRASNPRFLKSKKTTLTLDPATETQVSVSNFGNYTAQPIITFFGGLSTVGLNLEYGSEVVEFRLNPSVTIADGDFYKLDVANKTLKNEAGENVFNDLAENSDTLTIPSGASYFVIPASYSNPTSANANIEIIFRDSYK